MDERTDKIEENEYESGDDGDGGDGDGAGGADGDDAVVLLLPLNNRSIDCCVK